MSEYYDLPYTGAEVVADLAKVHDKESLVEDAPSDGVAYAQSNGEWAESSVDQLGTALDAIKGDETGDGLVGKLKEIVTSKLLIKKSLTDADVENVGDVLRSYADMIRKIAKDMWLNVSLSDNLFNDYDAITELSYIRVNTSNPSRLLHTNSQALLVKKVHHIEFANCDVNNAFKDCTALTEVNNISAPLATDASYMFSGCTALTEVNNISAPLATDASYMFSGCTALTEVDGLSLPSGANVGNIFSNCTSLIEVDGLMFPDCSISGYDIVFKNCESLIKVSNLSFSNSDYYIFYDCESLTEVDGLDLSKLQYVKAFCYCPSLIKVNGLDLASALSISSLFFNTSGVHYIQIINIGKSDLTTYSLSFMSKWGVEDETVPLSSGARQSLIDTLITYSYDRATAGMSACTITLSSTTKALLTDTEKAQITAKGFTLA